MMQHKEKEKKAKILLTEDINFNRNSAVQMKVGEKRLFNHISIVESIPTDSTDRITCFTDIS